jgi:hypothetical protein
MIRNLVLVLLLLAAVPLPLAGQEYRVEKIDTPAPADQISPEIAALLVPTGFRVLKGQSPVCEIWPAKEWPLAEGAKTSAEVQYPLTLGQVVGAARYPRKGTDFRDQDVPAGTYVMRYGQQPVDGAHVGTFPTRDFFLLLPAQKDRDPKALDYKSLVATSIQTTGTAHPAILPLLAAAESGEPLSIREDSEKQWTIVRFTGRARQGGMVKDLPVEIVVVGVAAE